MDPRIAYAQLMTRRHFFGRVSTGIGVAALAQLLGPETLFADASETGGLPGLPHFPAKAKRIIYLFQSGGPSQLEMFDYKPQLEKWSGDDLPGLDPQGPAAHRHDGDPGQVPGDPSGFKFAQYGKTGTWVSELLPHTAKIVDELCFIKSMYTEQINHDPAVTFAQTGFQLAGRPSLGSWVAYGLGSENKDLPGFVVMVSQNRSGNGGQPLSDRFWGTGFLPTKYQGVKLRGGGDPVLYLTDPEGFQRAQRQRFIEDLDKLNQLRVEEFDDPGDQHADRAVRDGVPDADVGAGADRSVEGARTAPSSCTARRRGSRGLVRVELPAGAAARRARRAFRPALSPRLGPPRRSGARHHGSMRGDRSGVRRPDHGSEGARAAGGHAGRVGRRVRPHRCTARAR